MCPTRPNQSSPVIQQLRNDRIGSRRWSARWRRWQTELAPDRLDRLLDRPVGRVQPALVGVKPTQGRGCRDRGCEPRPGLVDTVKALCDPFRVGRKDDSCQAAVEQLLRRRGVTQIGLRSGEVVPVAALQRVKVRIQPTVSGCCDHQIPSRQSAPGRADREPALRGGPRRGFVRRRAGPISRASRTNQCGATQYGGGKRPGGGMT